jgi:hypothetical protein
MPALYVIEERHELTDVVYISSEPDGTSRAFLRQCDARDRLRSMLKYPEMTYTIKKYEAVSTVHIEN